MATHRIQVTTRAAPGLPDARGGRTAAMLHEDHGIEVGACRVILDYLLNATLTPEDLDRLVVDLFADPIVEAGSHRTPLLDDVDLFPSPPDLVVQVGFKPGVTDNPGHAALDGFHTMFPDRVAAISTLRTYALWSVEPGSEDAIIAALHNPQIERAVVAHKEACAQRRWPQSPFPERPKAIYAPPATIDLDVDDEALMSISEEGLLALNLEEMRAIQAHYHDDEVRKARAELGLPPNQPTDAELECLAQTWSEHCKHKIFAARIHHIDSTTGEDVVIDSLFKTHIMRPTLEMQEEVDWLLSVFHDNSGVIAWTDDWSLCMKAETHNSPSALDPYGGAMTGIVGVNRDILGTGLGARPIANTDVFCFGPPSYAGTLPGGLFHPARVLRGVHAGVRDGGNESGIPTVNGAIVFDDRYIGKPLVYCGTVGLLPRTLEDGRAGHDKTPEPGDLIWMVGGRVGSDGIHGATFSSLELTAESPSSAVQIGDPITQKKMVDMLLEARDVGLISVITDNGAGGLSSSVGEMAELTHGAHIDLATVPLKQVGLRPWEILVSESQERMTVGTRPEHAEAFRNLASLHEVEATVIGTFTSDGTFSVVHGDDPVASLPIEFLHDGCPQLQLESRWTPPVHAPIHCPEATESQLAKILVALMGRPNIASKEAWVRSYDHEVLAQTVVKPFVGVAMDAPGDAAVLAPIAGSTRGVVVSNGIVPRYSDLDAGAMAAASVDEALRNAICVGVDPERIAGLDNFCWPDPVQSTKTPDGRQKLAHLVRANRALEAACRAFRLPCISGKDSMKNDAHLDGEKISVPPTLLFSLIGDHPDVRTAVTSDFKEVGDRIYLLGATHQELGASELAHLLKEEGNSGIGGAVPKLDAERNLRMYRSLVVAMRQGLIRSAHDCSDGGLAVAAMESCFGMGAGAELDVTGPFGDDPNLDAWGVLFGESLGRILVSVRPEHVDAFEELMQDHCVHALGSVIASDELVLRRGDEVLTSVSIELARRAWKGALGGDSA